MASLGLLKHVLGFHYWQDVAELDDVMLYRLISAPGDVEDSRHVYCHVAIIRQHDDGHVGENEGQQQKNDLIAQTGLQQDHRYIAYSYSRHNSYLGFLG